MNKFLYSVIILIFSTLPAFSLSLEGGVKYTVDDAREYIFNGVPRNVQIYQAYIFKQSQNVERTVKSYNNFNQLIGITVLYKNELDKTYIYGADKRLIYVEQYDKPVSVYPHRGYRYDLQGKLVLTSLTVSKSEMFRFEPDGKLVVHSIDGIIYDENGNVIGRGK